MKHQSDLAKQIDDLAIALRKIRRVDIGVIPEDHELENCIRNIQSGTLKLDAALSRTAAAFDALSAKTFQANTWQYQEGISRVRIAAERARSTLGEILESYNESIALIDRLNSKPEKIFEHLRRLEEGLSRIDSFFPTIFERLGRPTTSSDISIDEISRQHSKSEIDGTKTLELDIDQELKRYTINSAYVSINDEFTLRHIEEYRSYLIGISKRIVAHTSNISEIMSDAFERYHASLRKSASRVDFLELGLIGDEIRLYFPKCRPSLSEDAAALVEAFLVNHEAIMNQSQKWKGFRSASLTSEGVLQRNRALFACFIEVFEKLKDAKDTFDSAVTDALTIRLDRLKILDQRLRDPSEKDPAYFDIRQHFISGIRDVLLFLGKTVSQLMTTAKGQFADKGGKLIAASIIGVSLAFLESIKELAIKLAIEDPTHFGWLKSLYDLIVISLH
jgi:hypothetical protein